jgi:hypothetical protein
LLPKGFIIKKNKGLILIINVNDDATEELDLFKYKGRILPTIAWTMDNDYNKINISIDNSILDIWAALRVGKTNESDHTGILWENMYANYEDMNFDGDNRNREFIRVKNKYNETTHKYEQTKELERI